MIVDLNFSIFTIVPAAALLLLTLYIVICYRGRVARVAERRAALEAGERVEDSRMKPVSVVVYACENSERLEKLLERLLCQNYAPGYEVIVVNDGGGHSVGDMVTRYSHKFPHLKLTFVPDNAHNLSRRKLAITLGIKAAAYDYILLTTADCELPGEEWVHSMARHFADGNEVVLGVSTIKGDDGERMSFMNRMGELHDTVAWVSEALRDAAYRGTRYNMGYSKALFFKHKGFARTLNIHDGDDDLFVSEIAAGNKVAVEISGDSIVDVCTVKPSLTYKEDKKRHAFTARLSDRNPARIINSMPWLLWLSIALGVAAGVTAIPNPVPGAVAFVLLAVQWIVVSRAWAKSSAAVGMKVSGWGVIPGLLRMPFHKMKYSLSSRRDTHLNYTWHS